MTEKMRLLALKHMKGFLVGRGLPDPHVEYLRNNLTPEELHIGGKELMRDLDARKVLVAGYKNLGQGRHNFTKRGEDVIVKEIYTQINLMLYAAIHREYGYLDEE